MDYLGLKSVFCLLHSAVMRYGFPSFVLKQDGGRGESGSMALLPVEGDGSGGGGETRNGRLSLAGTKRVY